MSTRENIRLIARTPSRTYLSLLERSISLALARFGTQMAQSRPTEIFQIGHIFVASP